MSRLYSIGFTDVAVSAAQDMINIDATANMAFKIHRIELGQRTLAAWESASIVLIRYGATITDGSGGSVVTPRPLNTNDQAATITARANDTTGMTGSGVYRLLMRNWELQNGFYVLFTPEERPTIAPGQGMALRLANNPSGSMTASGTVVVEELF